jgi:leucyl aminopeptidase
LFAAVLKANIKRQRRKITDLKKTALSAELDNGSLVTWLMISEKKSTFQIQTLLRKALDKILSENPKLWQLSMNQKIMMSG